MNLNPDQLVTFARVAEAKSFSRAAVKMRLTQPAVSNQMARLSAAVGEPLFVRRRQGVELTGAGRDLLPHARAVVRALEWAEEVAEHLRGLEAGSVSVASSTTIASYLLPAVLARYKKEHPRVDFDVFVGNTREAVRRLEGGGAEVALVEGPVDRPPPGIERHLVRRDEIVLVTLPGHPLAGKVLEPYELDGLEVVWREKGSGTREVAERALEGVRLTGVLELVGSEAVKEAVAEGIGAAFLSRLVVDREARSGTFAVTSVVADGMMRELTLLRPSPELLSRACRAFLDELVARVGS